MISVSLPRTFCPWTGKVSYRTKAAAKRALSLMRDQGEPVVRVYRCACSSWHVTSQDRR